MSGTVIEAVARAIWETWRVSHTARPEYRDLGWEELVHLATSNPSGNAAQLVELGEQEARAAIAALADNVSDEMVEDGYRAFRAPLTGMHINSEPQLSKYRFGKGLAAALRASLPQTER